MEQDPPPPIPNTVPTLAQRGAAAVSKAYQKQYRKKKEDDYKKLADRVKNLSIAEGTATLDPSISEIAKKERINLEILLKKAQDTEQEDPHQREEAAKEFFRRTIQKKQAELEASQISAAASGKYGARLFRLDGLPASFRPGEYLPINARILQGLVSYTGLDVYELVLLLPLLNLPVRTSALYILLTGVPSPVICDSFSEMRMYTSIMRYAGSTDIAVKRVKVAINDLKQKFTAKELRLEDLELFRQHAVIISDTLTTEEYNEARKTLAIVTKSVLQKTDLAKALSTLGIRLSPVVEDALLSPDPAHFSQTRLDQAKDEALAQLMIRVTAADSIQLVIQHFQQGTLTLQMLDSLRYSVDRVERTHPGEWNQPGRHTFYEDIVQQKKDACTLHEDLYRQEMHSIIQNLQEQRQANLTSQAAIMNVEHRAYQNIIALMYRFTHWLLHIFERSIILIYRSIIPENIDDDLATDCSTPIDPAKIEDHIVDNIIRQRVSLHVHRQVFMNDGVPREQPPTPWLQFTCDIADKSRRDLPTPADLEKLAAFIYYEMLPTDSVRNAILRVETHMHRQAVNAIAATQTDEQRKNASLQLRQHDREALARETGQRVIVRARNRSEQSSARRGGDKMEVIDQVV